MQRPNRMDIFGICCLIVSIAWLTFLNWKLGALVGVALIGVTSLLYSDMMRLEKAHRELMDYSVRWIRTLRGRL